MIGNIFRFYTYCIASIVLFAGAFIAIPLTYNMESLNEAHAQAEIVELDELSLELTYLS